MKTTLLPALRLFLLLTLLTGVLYPAVVTVLGSLIFPTQAHGSLVMRSNQSVGSSLLAQKFEQPRYFWPRPTASDFATLPSGASNLGTISAKLHVAIEERAAKLREAHALSQNVSLPEDLLTSSASGLDPHITPEAAGFQIQRVAQARHLNPEQLEGFVKRFIEAPQFGVFGEHRVNVLLLNLALDQINSPM